MIINRVFLLFGLYIIREVTDIRLVCVVYSIVHDFCFQLYQKVFVIDFIPSGLAYLMKKSAEPYVKNFLLKTLHPGLRT